MLTISVKNKILRCEMRGGSRYLARSRAEATDLFRVTHARTDKLRKLASIREMIGLDLTDWPDGRRIMPKADLRDRRQGCAAALTPTCSGDWFCARRLHPQS